MAKPSQSKRSLARTNKQPPELQTTMSRYAQVDFTKYTRKLIVYLYFLFKNPRKNWRSSRCLILKTAGEGILCINCLFLFVLVRSTPVQSYFSYIRGYFPKEIQIKTSIYRNTPPPPQTHCH